MNKNKESTRFFSSQHEASVCKALGGKPVSNSGAGRFDKGDVVLPDASMLIECKCSMNDKNSFSIKKEWLDTLKNNCFRERLCASSICFNFGPNSDNYYVIDQNLMKTLVEILANPKKF